MENKYRISVHLNPQTTLTYRVDSYEMQDDGLIRFIDKKYNVIKIFDSRLCEIEEVLKND